MNFPNNLSAPGENAVIGDLCPIPRFVSRKFPDDFDKLDTCDAIRYARAMRQAVTEYPDTLIFDNNFDHNASAAAIDRVIKKPDFNTLVCEHEGAIVAAISYARPSPGTLELGYLFCLGQARGKAIGRLLLRDGLRMTQAKGDTCVVLSVLPRNTKAIEFYESIGFRAETRTTSDPRIATTMRLRGERNILRAVAILTDQIAAAQLDTQEADSL